MINYQTIREQVASHLRGKILRMEIRPGERVLEQDIADQLGISRGPVRESLRQLEQEGLLEYRRNRGCIVRKFEKSDAEEIFFIRSTLECAAIDCCGGQIGEKFLALLQQTLDQLKGACEAGDTALFFEKDESFHALLVQACGKPRLFDVWNSMASIGFVLFLTEEQRQFDLHHQYDRHVQVYRTLCSGDKEKIKAEIRDHYLRNSDLFLS